MGIQIKKFRASSLQKAIEDVRNELGDDAIILQTETVREGLLGRSSIEVTAAIDRKDAPIRFRATVSDDDEELNKATGTTGSGSQKKRLVERFVEK